MNDILTAFLVLVMILLHVWALVKIRAEMDRMYHLVNDLATMLGEALDSYDQTKTKN